jgi:hypothetical protein
MQTKLDNWEAETWAIEVVGYPGKKFEKCYLCTGEMLEF